MFEINLNNKKYRCVRKSSGVSFGGRWQFKYKDKWHEVINYSIKIKLNKILLEMNHPMNEFKKILSTTYKI